jgi:hypothetical protein
MFCKKFLLPALCEQFPTHALPRLMRFAREPLGEANTALGGDISQVADAIGVLAFAF